MLRLDMPMGLNAASAFAQDQFGLDLYNLISLVAEVEQLKQHWETVRKDRGRDDAILQS